MTIKPRIRPYLLGLIAWECAVIVPLAIVFINAGRKVRAQDFRLLLVVIAFGVFVVAVCSAIASRRGRVLSVVLGFAGGVTCAAAGGIVWASLVTGFEAPSAILVGCLLLSVPSGVGGAIAGWLNRRRTPQFQ